MSTDKLIESAEKYAAAYDVDDRQDIKTDVLNAFYAGAKSAQPSIHVSNEEALRSWLDDPSVQYKLANMQDEEIAKFAWESALTQSAQPAEIWMASNKTSAVAFATKELAEKYVCSFSAGVAGGMGVYAVPIIGAVSADKQAQPPLTEVRDASLSKEAIELLAGIDLEDVHDANGAGEIYCPACRASTSMLWKQGVRLSKEESKSFAHLSYCPVVEARNLQSQSTAPTKEGKQAAQPVPVVTLAMQEAGHAAYQCGGTWADVFRAMSAAPAPDSAQKKEGE